MWTKLNEGYIPLNKAIRIEGYSPQITVKNVITFPRMEQELRQAVAEVLIGLRKEKRISQHELALRTQMDRSYISEIERKISTPTLYRLFKLALGLGVEPDEMVQRIQQKCPSMDSWLSAEAG